MNIFRHRNLVYFLDDKLHDIVYTVTIPIQTQYMHLSIQKHW